VYELSVTSRFAAAHQLRNYKGRCENLHGHNWKIEASVAVTELDEIGLGLDFTELKAALHEVLDELDHKMLNELSMFQHDNPSSENISRWIFERLSERLNDDRVKVARVTTWESDEARATYTQGGR
jgi:6-pyruvoyltetrahydropterin/6-carboxytetrahydropterin synthase